ncbi:MAG: nucleotidyltransferase domain-containing protein [Planctomycetes bacterium]|nr:nucleotidyltransferase domain-containing protein [Planctomycetota bacterium]
MVRREVLKDIVGRIVEVANPERIVMFGSAVRGEMGPDSDIDLLVIKQGPVHRRRLARAIYRRMIGVGQAVDVIVATPEDIARYGQSPGLVYRSALQEGVDIYVATPASSSERSS